MPLTAVLDGQRVDSVLSTDDEWLELKKTYKARSLLTSCGLPAFPRTSNHGLRHFVHKADSKCSVLECWSETPQHRAGKAIVARAVADVGWLARIEHQADDRSWTADVLAEKDGRRVAFEIQWSKQGSPEFAARQERYERAGVECFWFVHRRNRATADEAGVPYLVFEGDNLPLDLLAHRAFQEDEPTPLSEVTRLILTGGFLRRAEAKATAVTLEILEMTCWACKRDSTIWRIGALDVRTRCQKISSFERSTYGKAWPTERLESSIMDTVAAELATQSPVAPLRMHYSKTTKSSYLAYGCAHCERGFFGDFFIMDSYDWEEVDIPINGRIPLAESLQDDAHICQDNGFGMCSQRPRDHGGPVFSGCRQDHKDMGADEQVSIQVVGQDMSIREAALRLTGLWQPPTTFTPRTEPARRKMEPTARTVAPGDCDLCGAGEHPEYTCLWRSYRTLVKVPIGGRHFSDDIHARITEGVLDEIQGTEILRGMLDRVQANKSTYGSTGSVSELVYERGSAQD